MSRCVYPKKLRMLVGLCGSVRRKGDLTACFASGSARAHLEQLWSTEATRGLSVLGPKQFAVLAGKAFFLPPKTWKRLYLPFKVQMEGGTSVAMALQKEGIIAGLSITKGGQLQVNTYNTTDTVVYLTPKIAMVHAWADEMEIKYQGKDPRILCIHKERILDFGEKLCEEIRQKYPKVGDFSTHPINDKLARLSVRATEVRWA